MKSEFWKRAFPVLMFVLSLLVVVAPYAVFATGPLDTPLVPACDASVNGDPSIRFGGACQLCDLVSLGQNIVQFAVAFSVLVATLMFAYAGVLYFTASSKPDNIKKGHEVFVKTFVGLVIILIAFILVDVIMKTLVQGDPFSGPWQKIQCAEYPHLEALNQNVDGPTPTVSGGGGGNGGSGGLRYNQAAETAARTRIATMPWLSINNGGAICTTPQISGCTNVGGLSESVYTGLTAIHNQCNCDVQITGGTEQGPHQGHTGNQVDISFNQGIAQYVHDNASALHVTQVCTTAADAAYRVNCNTNESQNHLHIGFGG